MQDEQKMAELMKNIHQVKLQKKAKVLRPEDREDPQKYINRNLELAHVWQEYDEDRKRLVSEYHAEKLVKAKQVKESLDTQDRNMKMIKNRRWEIFREQQQIKREEHAKFVKA